MNKPSFIFMVLVVQILKVSAQQINLKTDDLNLTVSQSGQITEMVNPSTGNNYQAAVEKAPSLRILNNSVWEAPSQAAYNSKSGTFPLNFAVSKISADIKVIPNKSHKALRFVHMSAKDQLIVVCRGSYPTTIGMIIGEVIGVVHDGEYAAGSTVVCDGTALKIYTRKRGFLKDIPFQQAVPSLKA